MSGSRPEWQRRLAVQRREEDQRARERARQARERDREQEQPGSRQREAEEKTAEVQRQITVLDEVLASALTVPPLTFERLKVVPKAAPFDPGPLASALPAPEWDDFAPAAPRGLRRFLGGAVRHRRETAKARALFAAAQAEHRQQETGRRQALAAAKALYDQKVTEERARAAARNALVSGRQSAFMAGDAESVEWLVRRVLGASRYPDGFPRGHQVTYRRENRGVVVEFEFPAPDVVPPVRAYRYVRTRDVIEPVPRPDTEISQRYLRLQACIALRTLHEIFGATPPGVVDTVMFDGRVTTVDPATGKPAHPHLLGVSAERSAFGDLVLAEVDPVACMTHLGASVSPVPFGPENTEPFMTGDS
ncbi:MAG: hypothetical protein JOY82_14225 [Streptosporangiaceae bacterium]|nr:hypothetical protein [Streptosporangiaceae bacterium]